MTPEQTTPENVEEQIQHVVRTHGSQNLSTPTSIDIIRELDMLYRSEEGVMARTWERLVEQHPEVGNMSSSEIPPPPSILSFPQQLHATKTTQKGWKRTANVLLAVAISLILIVSSFLLFHQNQSTPPAHKVPVSTGPLQLLDRHGKLFYQSDGKKTLTSGNDTANFAQYTLEQLVQDIHVEPAKLFTMGLRVTTTLDLDLQNKAYANAQQQISKLKNTKNINDCAIVVLDYHNGSIRALIGSLNASQQTGYNAATQNGRQLGSAYKPFVYATAFDQGISPGDVVNDVRTTFPGDYTPMNYDQQFHGLISYRTALQNDYNIPAIQLLTRTQIVPTIAKVTALGVPPSRPVSQYGYALALGTDEATVLNATVAYSTMANQGVHITPNAIAYITDTTGRILFQAKNQGTRALSPAAAFMITDVLSDNTARAATFGTCSPMVLYTTSQAQCLAGNPGSVRPTAASVGTTDTFRDNWTLGYTSDYAVGVWSGNDDFAPMMNATSLDGAAPIWHDTMLLAEGNAPIQQFPSPPNTVIKKTITDQGLTTTDWHLK